jgi:hypothetical protein
VQTRQTREPAAQGLPDADSLAALRGWYAGLSSRAAVARYLGGRRAAGVSSRGLIGDIRRQLIAFAHGRHRPDLAAVFEHTITQRRARAGTVERTLRTLGSLPVPQPQVTDDVALWFAPRTVGALHGHGIRTLTDLTVRIPRRRQWWTRIKGLGATGAHAIEAFFAAHPALTGRARALITLTQPAGIVPWEQLRLPHEVDGSQGTLRAPRDTCTLNATNDYEAVQAWLALHETATTQRAYRKEAERLILWAIVERGRAFSSLTTDDAIAYRTFVRRPSPRERWVGAPRPRDSVEWRPFTGGLSARSTAYALTVLSALYRWLIEQRYVLANPFAGVKVRGAALRPELDTTRGFTEGEWLLLRAVADGLEWSSARMSRSTASRGFTSLAKAANPAGWRYRRWQPMRLINICLNDTCRSHGSAGTRLRRSLPASASMRARVLRARTCGASCAGSSLRPLACLRVIIRSWRKNCTARARTGCGTPTPVMHSRAARS